MTVSGIVSKERSRRCRVMDGPFGRRYYAILYAIECPAVGKIKIGRTLDMAKRFGALSTVSPAPLTLLGYLWLPDDVEAEAHHYLKDHRSHGEWFDSSAKVREFADLVARKKVMDISAALHMDWMLVVAAPPVYEPPPRYLSPAAPVPRATAEAAPVDRTLRS